MTGTIHFDGITRTITDAFQIDSRRVLMVLEAEGQPTLAVTGHRYRDSGLITDMVGWHRVKDPAHFAAKVAMLIEIGAYD